jgi:hypothetical protein
MKAFLFGRPEIDLGNLKSTPRLPEWRAQILTSVEPCSCPIEICGYNFPKICDFPNVEPYSSTGHVPVPI